MALVGNLFARPPRRHTFFELTNPRTLFFPTTQQTFAAKKPRPDAFCFASHVKLRQRWRDFVAQPPVAADVGTDDDVDDKQPTQQADGDDIVVDLDDNSDNESAPMDLVDIVDPAQLQRQQLADFLNYIRPRKLPTPAALARALFGVADCETFISRLAPINFSLVSIIPLSPVGALIAQRRAQRCAFYHPTPPLSMLFLFSPSPLWVSALPSSSLLPPLPFLRLLFTHSLLAPFVSLFFSLPTVTRQR